jgi:hypothetical protein
MKLSAIATIVDIMQPEELTLLLFPDWRAETLADLVDLLHTGRSSAGPLARMAGLQRLLSCLGIQLDHSVELVSAAPSAASRLQSPCTGEATTRH